MRLFPELVESFAIELEVLFFCAEDGAILLLQPEGIFGSCLIDVGVLAVVGCSFPKALKAFGLPIFLFFKIIFVLFPEDLQSLEWY